MPERTRFVADAMLGSLARKLRAFGFDTVYYREGSDAGLINLARAESRVILTSDRRLESSAESAGVVSLLLKGRTDGRLISSLVDGAAGRGLRLVRGPPLCSLCGGELAALDGREATRMVPAAVISRHRRFLQCASCGRCYWRGGHWKKLSRLERALPPRRSQG